MELYLICVSPGSHLFFYGQDVKWWEVITHLFSRAGFPVPSSSSSWVSARSRFTALVSCEISSVFSCRGELLTVGIPCVTRCLFSEPRRATPPYLYPSPPHLPLPTWHLRQTAPIDVTRLEVSFMIPPPTPFSSPPTPTQSSLPTPCLCPSSSLFGRTN